MKYTSCELGVITLVDKILGDQWDGSWTLDEL